MSDKMQQAIAQCAAHGIAPLAEPMGDDHHCEAPFSQDDLELGSGLAWFLGTLFSDVEVEGEHCRYWYHERTSEDEWRRVARALRIHGLRIAPLSDPA